MAYFEPQQRLPRLEASPVPSLAALIETPADMMTNHPFDLRLAHFYPHGERVSTAELEAWRSDLNSWASDKGFGNKTVRKSDWDVELGLRLIQDLDGHPEADHPEVWCWLATNLLPHFVVFRWGWPGSRKTQSTDIEVGDDLPTSGPQSWARFGPTDKNALFLARYRVLVFGETLARRASQQEFQSLHYRPAYGLDPRVARVILSKLVSAFDDPDSNYGKHGGIRKDDCNDVCIELQKINSLQPLCFRTDEEIIDLVESVVKRLPQLRRPPKPTTREMAT